MVARPLDPRDARPGPGPGALAPPARRAPWRAAAAVAVAAALAANLLAPRDNLLTAAGAAWQAVAGTKKPDVIYVPTPPDVVDRMLALAEVRPGDVLYDLGCGDGRIVVAAAERFGVKAVGYDIDPKRVAEARENVRKHRLEHLVTIKQEDIFQADLTGASVVTMYLLPNLNVRLMPQLARLRPGSRIVSHAFDMKGAKPSVVEKIPKGNIGLKLIFLWVVPWEKE